MHCAGCPSWNVQYIFLLFLLLLFIFVARTTYICLEAQCIICIPRLSAACFCLLSCSWRQNRCFVFVSQEWACIQASYFLSRANSVLAFVLGKYLSRRVVLDSWIVSQIWLDSDWNESSQSWVALENINVESSQSWVGPSEISQSRVRVKNLSRAHPCL